jgi:hypothetical protein
MNLLEAANKLSPASASPLAITMLPLLRIQLLLFPSKIQNGSLSMKRIHR